MTYVWTEPVGNNTGIIVKNSLAKNNKVPLITVTQNRLSWYTCGPTVYDNSHIGHARAYVSVDIIQRILTDYYNINVVSIMGITDVDDKIVEKALKTNQTVSQVASFYEKEFLDKMDNLNIRKPYALTRVTEHIEDIKRFIKKLIDLEAAYVINGSVYFSMANYNGGKLLVSIDELTPYNENCCQNDKRDFRDFALWKKVSENEPHWNSDWGIGRPGWHIECSAMINTIFSGQLDVHSGGIDLKFPHHENEIAQTSTYFELKDDENWPNYFLHIGHLNINGRKMSKSEKNFIKIEDLLKDYTANNFRMFCLTKNFSSSVDYSTVQMNAAVLIEKKLFDFVAEMETVIKYSENNKRWQSRDFKLFEYFVSSQDNIRDALSNNFDTKKSINVLLSIRNYIYSDIKNIYSKELLCNILSYVKKILNIFGLVLPTCNNINLEYTLLVDTLVDFRKEIKEVSVKNDNKKIILKLCDNLRDVILPNLKIKLCDNKDNNPVWHFIE